MSGLHAKEGPPIASIDGADTPIQPDNDSLFRHSGSWSNLRQSLTLLGNPGHPTSIRFSDFGNLDELVLVPPAEAFDAGAIAGRYRSESTETLLTILESEGGLTLSSVGRFGSAQLTLEYLAQDIWRAKSTNHATVNDGILLFDGNNARLRMHSFPASPLIGDYFTRTKAIRTQH